MGARLWSQRRRASPQPCHAQTIIPPAAFTHSDKLPAATTTADLGRVPSVTRYPSTTTTIRPSPPNDTLPPNNSLPPENSSLPPDYSLPPDESLLPPDDTPPDDSLLSPNNSLPPEYSSFPPNNSLPTDDSSSLPPEHSFWPMEYGKDGQSSVQPNTSATKKKKKRSKETRDHFSSTEQLLQHQQQQHQQLHPHYPQQHQHYQQPSPYQPHQPFHYSSSSQQGLWLGMEPRGPTPTGYHRKADPTLNLPHQVPRPDGEERYHPKKYQLRPHDRETMATIIVPPANRSVTDVDNEATHRPTNLLTYSTPGECGPYYPLQYPTSSSSSSSSQLGYGDEGRSSPRRSRQMSENLVSQIHPHLQTQLSPNKSYQETSRRAEWSEEGLGISTPSPSHDPTLPYSTTSSTLAEITSVGCGPTGLRSSERHAGGLRDSQTMSDRSLGVQRGVSQRFEQFPESSCSPTAEHDYPPVHSDVIDDSILDTSVSRPSEQRTKSGKI